MKDVSFDGATGKVAFDEFGDTTTRVLTAYEVKDGKWTDVSTEEFYQVMLTNALAPMRVIERLQQAVKPQGLLGVMSSGQGSLTNNLTGQRELYRGSKAALNMFMRSFAARPSSASHPLVVMAPGWIRTELGGADAPLTIEETIPRLVNVLLDKRQRPGLEYLDYQGRTVPW